MKHIDKQNDLAIVELSQAEVEFVSGGDPSVPKPACECHTDRQGNLVCQDANGRTCG